MDHWINEHINQLINESIKFNPGSMAHLKRQTSRLISANMAYSRQTCKQCYTVKLKSCY